MMNKHDNIFTTNKVIKFAYHITESKNVEEILRNGLVPKIGKLSLIINEPVEAIYLFPELKDAKYAMSDWMNEVYQSESKRLVEGEVSLTLLKINMKGYPFKFIDSDEFYLDREFIVYQPILSKDIQVTITDLTMASFKI